MQWLRIFVAIAASAALMALAGCGKKEDDGAAKTPSGEPATAAADAAGKVAVPTPVADAAPTAPADAAAPKGDGKPPDRKGDETPASAGDDGPPKNLKVLPKSWSRKKVKTYMKEHVAKALGVDCDYCHDEDDFAADESEHKTISLDMMKMERDINRRFFGGKSKVTCYTCHLGEKEPPK